MSHVHANVRRVRHVHVCMCLCRCVTHKLYAITSRVRRVFDRGQYGLYARAVWSKKLKTGTETVEPRAM